MSAPSTGAFLRPPLELLGRHPEVYGATPDEQTLRLANALACGPLWAALSTRMGMAVRTGPVPVIAILGAPSGADAPLLDAAGWQVRDALERLLPVGWEAAVALSDVLADRLTERLGDRLAGAALVGVPRGGVLVAGLLSYALGLPVLDERPVPGGAGHELVVAVDDCALSGARLHRWLATRSERVVVAHLHSHPALRAAVEAHERVVACVAAADLTDHAPHIQGEGHEAWVTRWRERSPDDLWTGHPDHVAYPWNEPDVSFWDDLAGRAAPGWRVVPPQWCVKNRAVQVAGGAPQRCSPAAGPVQPGPEVVWCDLGDRTVVADAATGAAVTLDGVAADLWSSLLATGEVEAGATDVAERYDVPVERVRDDLDAFVGQCREAGLLAP